MHGSATRWWTDPWSPGTVRDPAHPFRTPRGATVPATFNHTIIAARDRAESARFLRELLELAEAPSWGPFINLLLDGGVLLQFPEPPVDEIQMQHYAFLVDDELFDR